MKKYFKLSLFAFVSILSLNGMAQTQSYFQNLCEMPRPCDDCQPSGLVWDAKCKDPQLINRNFESATIAEQQSMMNGGAGYSVYTIDRMSQRNINQDQNSFEGNRPRIAYGEPNPSGVMTPSTMPIESVGQSSKGSNPNMMGNSDYARGGNQNSYMGNSDYARSNSGGYASTSSSGYATSPANTYMNSAASGMSTRDYNPQAATGTSTAPASGGKYNSSVSNPFALCSMPRPCDKCQPLRSQWDDICPAGEATPQDKQATNSALSALGMSGMTQDIYRSEMAKIDRSRQELTSGSGSEINSFMDWKKSQPSPTGVGTVGDDWNKLRAANSEDVSVAEQQIKKQAMMEIEMANAKNEQVLNQGTKPPLKPWELR